VTATATEPDMPGVSAAARSLGYAILAELIGDGVSEENLDRARLSPRLQAIVDGTDLERLAADHFHVFGMMAPPFEGLLVDPDAQVGNEATDALRGTLAALGIELSPADEPEHLSTQLRILAALCDHPVAAARFIDNHVLPWLLPYEAAVRRCDRPLPTALIAETLDLLFNHRGSIPAHAVAPIPSPAGAEDVTDVYKLDHPETDLRTIATVLSRPAFSGILLTKHDITAISRSVNVPRGFGSRALMVQHLLRNAAQLDTLSAVLAALDDIARDQTDAVTRRIAASNTAWLRAGAVPWLDRIAATRAALDRIAREATPPG